MTQQGAEHGRTHAGSQGLSFLHSQALAFSLPELADRK